MSANPLTDHDQFIHRSQYPDASIPDTALTPVILRKAAELGDTPAIIDGPSGRVMTYRQLASDIQSVAAGLAVRDLSKGDVLAIYAPNVPEYAVAFHAVISIGGIVSTANPLLTSGELSGQVQDGNAKFLLTVPGLLDPARDAARSAGIPDNRI